MIHCGGELYVDGEVIMSSISHSDDDSSASDSNNSTYSSKGEKTDDKKGYIHFLSNLTRTNVITSHSLNLFNSSYSKNSGRKHKVELLMMLLKKGIFYPVDE